MFKKRYDFVKGKLCDGFFKFILFLFNFLLDKILFFIVVVNKFIIMVFVYIKNEWFGFNVVDNVIVCLIGLYIVYIGWLFRLWIKIDL